MVSGWLVAPQSVKYLTARPLNASGRFSSSSYCGSSIWVAEREGSRCGKADTLEAGISISFIKDLRSDS